MDKKLPIYLADIETDEDRMLALSFTEHPASGYHGKIIHDDDEQGAKVFFPILPANKPIYRNNGEYGEHYVIFLPDVITDIIQDTNKRGVPFDFEHQGTPIDGIEWVESFQIDYQNGKLYRSYQGLTDGTWCAIVNMVNSRLRAKIQSKEFLGISISGIFSYHLLSLSEAIEFYNNIRL